MTTFTQKTHKKNLCFTSQNIVISGEVRTAYGQEGSWGVLAMLCVLI